MAASFLPTEPGARPGRRPPAQRARSSRRSRPGARQRATAPWSAGLPPGRTAPPAPRRRRARGVPMAVPEGAV